MKSDETTGSYLGVEIDRKWWKRYREDGLFARGSGRFWTDAEGVRFHRFLTKAPFTIRWDEITGVTLGKWHAGRWVAGRPVLRVEFTRHGLDLCAGFYLSSDWQRTERLAEELISEARSVTEAG